MRAVKRRSRFIISLKGLSAFSRGWNLYESVSSSSSFVTQFCPHRRLEVVGRSQVLNHLPCTRRYNEWHTQDRSDQLFNVSIGLCSLVAQGSFIVQLDLYAHKWGPRVRMKRAIASGFYIIHTHTYKTGPKVYFCLQQRMKESGDFFFSLLLRLLTGAKTASSKQHKKNWRERKKGRRKHWRTGCLLLYLTIINASLLLLQFFSPLKNIFCVVFSLPPFSDYKMKSLNFYFLQILHRWWWSQSCQMAWK